MNIARLFSYTKEVERQRDEWKARVERLEGEREKLIDAVARASKQPPVFNQSSPETQSNVPAVAIGPTAAAARRELRRREEEAATLGRAEEARKASNGHGPEIPAISQ